MIVELEVTKKGKKGSFIRLRDEDGNEDIMRFEEWLKLKGYIGDTDEKES